MISLCILQSKHGTLNSPVAWDQQQQQQQLISSMVGHGFLFSLPHSFFAAAECVASSQKSDNEDEALTAAISVEGSTHNNGPAAVKHRTVWDESGATCITCGIGVNSQGFTSSAEQRQHFKTDWHRYNLKRRLDKKPAVSEQDFERMIEAGDDVSSISGSDSDSSSDDHDDDEDDSDHDDEHQLTAGRTSQAQASIQGAQAVFRTADGVGFAVWRCLLLPDSHKHKQQDQSPDQLLRLLQQLRQTPDSSRSTAAAAAGHESQQPDTSGCLWALLMLRGGHFAAAVVRINSTTSSSRQPVAAVVQGGADSSSQQQQQRSRSQQVVSSAEPFTVLVHKTFHRYVVRAKAGGKQSTKDATGKYARSAGSRLRRYNETALQRDITQLLKDWAPYLRAAQLIFIAAPGSNSRVIFTAAADVAPLAAAAAAAGVQHQQQQGQLQQGVGSSSNPTAVLDPGDPRLRRVPFVTQRPTFSELKRVLLVLGSVRQVVLPSDAELAAVAAAAAEKVKPQQQSQQSRHHENEVQQPVVDVSSVGSAGVTRKQEEAPLIKASKSGDSERVTRLLTHGHDPTIRDSKGRTPYQLAANKEVRDAFRRFMASNPDAWDYSSSDIPSPLTEEMETAQQSKKAEKRARQKAKEKERKDSKANSSNAAAATAGGDGGGDSFDDELAAAMAEAAAISSRAAASGKSKQVGAGASSSSSSKGSGKGKSAPVAAAPDPAEVARRREQLAAAAEARLKALQQKQQLW